MTPGETSVFERLSALGALASGLCQDAGILLVLGNSWSWNPATRQLSVKASDLAASPLEECAGVVAHEAGHHLISRYLVFPEGQPDSELERMLLNAVEDARVEAFLPRRYPGVAPWLRRICLAQGFPPDAPLSVQFLLALASSSVADPDTLPLHPEVRAALASTREARLLAVEGFLPAPGLEVPQGFSLDPALFGQQLPEHRGPWFLREMYLRQLAWGVLRACGPLLEAVRALHRQDRSAGRELDATSVQVKLRRAGAAPVRVSLPWAVAPRVPAPSMPQLSQGSYEQAWRKVAAQAEELGATLERVLLPRRRLGWRVGFSSGQRLDLRGAMQAEADPRRLLRVWSRKTRPSRRSSAFSLLVDLSGSMRRGGRIEATLSAVALFAETLVRLGIPCRIDGFQDELIPFLDFGDPLDEQARRRLGAMAEEVHGKRPGGHNRPLFNDDGPCLDEAAARLLARPEQDHFLLVLCDGHPEGRRSGMRELVETIKRLRSQLTLIGLGLGPETSHVARLYPIARANLGEARLASELGALLHEHLSREG